MIELGIRVPSGSRQLKGARLLCDCGNEYTSPLISLRGGKSHQTLSCGCLNDEHRRDRVKAGICVRKAGGSRVHEHPLYSTWRGMNTRCSNPNAINWKYYGGRGIRVCDRWLNSFTDFATDIENEIGPKPTPSHSIDRIDNDGNYEPGNVRWATKKEQSMNRRAA